MKRLLILLNGLLLLGCSTGQTQQAENGITRPQPELSEAQTELIYQKTKSFPNNTQLSIAIIDGEKVHYIGIIRENDTVFQTENHRKSFEIGSISKVFTSTLLANFVINKQLTLENPIQDIVGFELKTKEPITFKELANHTSGLPRLPPYLDLKLVDLSNPYKNYDEENLKTYLKEQLKLNQAPGEKYEYSNLGAGLLGYLLGEISNSDYQKILEERILSKYEMGSTTTDRSKLKTQLIKGLDNNGIETSNWDLNVLAGAGGILSTVEDMSKFALAHFDQGNPELQLTHQPTFKISDTMQIGLGWHIKKASDGKNEMIWHNGGTGGYTSSMALNLKNRSGIIILSNVSAFHKKMGEIDTLCFALMNTL